MFKSFGKYLYDYLFLLKADDISGFHANTHIPIVIGAQMRYELTGDELYKVRGCMILVKKINIKLNIKRYDSNLVKLTKKRLSRE